MRLSVLLLVFSFACQSGTEGRCLSDAQCPAGQRCQSSRCVLPGASAADGGGGGGGGGGPVASGCRPDAPDNPTKDSDCDGLSDADEYAQSYAAGKKTDPCRADTDGDGLPDGLEMGKAQSPGAGCAFVADADPASKTDPTSPDSDGDGLADGEEDKSRDGKVSAGESNPLKKDSDCDAISDAEEVKGTRGCATDPLRLDSDGDGLPDGVEVGLVAPGAEPAQCRYGPQTFDADPATKTSACEPDSDKDGVMDGAEDLNQNGKLDPNELNPSDKSDAQGPVLQACATTQLRPVSLHLSHGADVQVALLPAFAQVAKLGAGTAAEKGLVFLDATAQIAGLVFSLPPAGATAAAEETKARAKLAAAGTVSAPITQTFTTWDRFESVRATYDLAAGGRLDATVNELARAFTGTSGSLSGGTGTGPFKVHAQYLRRSAKRAVVLLALTPAAAYSGPLPVRLDDVAGGSALAQVGDEARPQCEVFTTEGTATVDFLWVVDNSGSMGAYQQAVGNAGSLFGQKLASAGLDWRAGAVTTSYGAYKSATEYRPFTNTLATMQGWFDGQSATWFGVNGSGWELSLQSAQDYLQGELLPRTSDAASNKVRAKADLHVILLGDADDQSSVPLSTLTSFFTSYDGAGSKAVVHGIVCPEGQQCGETQATPRRNLAAIGATGGVQGDINVAQLNSPQLASTLDAILSVAIAGTGHVLGKPPIAATLKVAIEPSGTVGSCNTADVPRDRTNGFDFDAASRRLVFYGACRPTAAGKRVAVSYKFWQDLSADPDGDPCQNQCAAPLTCEASSARCVCPANCGGCPNNQVCDPSSCACSPNIN